MLGIPLVDRSQEHLCHLDKYPNYCQPHSAIAEHNFRPQALQMYSLVRISKEHAFELNCKIYLVEGVLEFHKFGSHASDRSVSSNHSVVMCLAFLQQLPTDTCPSNLALHAHSDTHGIQNTFVNKLRSSKFLYFPEEKFHFPIK